MFRKAQQSVAHQSTLPSGFGLGNRDFKSLQEIINTEKDFIKSNTRSAQDFHKVADSLKVWADSEGEDMQDVLGKLSLLLEHYTTAQSRFNAHLSTIRQHFKSVRTREETLAELKSRKRSLGSKIEGVEKKLAKMGPENKELMKTTASLKDLRSEMEGLRIEVQTEEAAIGDFKRRTAKEAMGIKCGGLLEFAEKMTIVAEIGKLMVEEIPLEYTHPGMPRADYLGGAKTDQLLQEATRSLADVGFAPAGSSTGQHRQDMSGMRGSEWDESGQDYGLPEGAHDGTYANYAAGQDEEPDQVEEADNSATPIYATHSSALRGRGDSMNARPELPEDSAADEWQRTSANAPQSHDLGMYGAQNSTPIADQFASRSPDEVQVGGTGLRMIGGDEYNNRSTESFERQAKPSTSGGALPAPPRLSTPPPQDYSLQTPEERYAPAPPAPAALTPAMSAQDDASYFQSVGSTRAAQQAIRRPTSPNSSIHASQSITGSFAQPPASPYEPQAEGRKMTAAAFRKGFARAPSAQHMGNSASSLGGAHNNGSGADLGGYGHDDGSATAPLAIRKRFSAVPGQSSAGLDDHAPAPPYDQPNRLSSAYGGYAGAADEYAPPMQPYADQPNASSHPVPGQFYTPSYNGSRPGSAAGYRTPGSYMS